MGIENLVSDRKDDLLACKTPQDVMSLLQEEGVELTDEQLEAVAGGVGANWSLEKLGELFADIFAGLLPEGYDPSSIWGNLPTGGMH